MSWTGSWLRRCPFVKRAPGGTGIGRSIRPRPAAVVTRPDEPPGPAVTRGGDAPRASGEDAAAVDGPFVTILIADLAGPARLVGRRRGRRAREHLARPARGGGVAHGGPRGLRSTGDGLMVAFASAVAAVRCAVEMQQRDHRRAPGRPGAHRPRRRRAVPEGDDLYGTPVIVAQRLCESAAPGEILASDVVRQVAGPRVGGADAARPGRCGCRGSPSGSRSREVRWRADDEPPDDGPQAARAGDHRRDRRRPAPAAHRLPRDPRRRARHHASSARRPTGAARRRRARGGGPTSC